MKQFNCFGSSIGRSGNDLISGPSWLLRSETRYCGKYCQFTIAHKSCHYHSLHGTFGASKSTFCCMHDHFVPSNNFVLQTSKWRKVLSDDNMACHSSFPQCHLNLPFLNFLYLEIWPWKSMVKVMGSKVKVMYRSNSSVLRLQLMNEANLKDLIAATGLVILLSVTLKWWHFKAIREFKLELQSG